MQTNTLDNDLLHVKEAAAELDVHPSTIRGAIHGGELEAVRLGTRGGYRVTRDALERFLRPVERRDDRRWPAGCCGAPAAMGAVGLLRVAMRGEPGTCLRGTRLPCATQGKHDHDERDRQRDDLRRT